jgi:hypothetical protein
MAVLHLLMPGGVPGTHLAGSEQRFKTARQPASSLVWMRLYPMEPAAGPWRVEPIERPIAHLLPQWPSGHPALLAIDGRSSSGKWTLATQIAGSSTPQPLSTPTTSPGTTRSLDG